MRFPGRAVPADWRQFKVGSRKRSNAYHAVGRRHGKPNPPLRGGALVIQRTELPRKAYWMLIVVSAVIMYILIFGGVL